MACRFDSYPLRHLFCYHYSVTKKQKIIYSIIFILFISAVTICIVKLNSQKSTTTQTLPAGNLIPKDIDWQTATDLIKSCQIKVIFQSRTLQINLRGHDNQIYYTSEPKFNDVINLAKEVQGPCDIIQTVTE